MSFRDLQQQRRKAEQLERRERQRRRIAQRRPVAPYSDDEDDAYPSQPKEKIQSVVPLDEQQDDDIELLRQQPSPKSLVDQIDGALQDHFQQRSSLKQQYHIEQSNTMERYTTPRKRRSAFSNLNDEIVQFQKVVNDCSKLLPQVQTPEEQWRCVRIESTRQ